MVQFNRKYTRIWYSDLHTGTTYLELMANFVATTGVCVPVAVTAKGSVRRNVDPASGEGIRCPRVTREMLITFIAAVKALSKKAGYNLVQGAHTKHIRSLSRWPAEPPSRKGRLTRPALKEAQATWEILRVYFKFYNAEAFRDYATRPAAHDTSSNLQRS